MTTKKPTNHEIAEALDRIARLLENQEENPFRVQAYRNGASTVRNYSGSVADLVESDAAGLEKLPGIGKGLSNTIREFVETGQIALLNRLESEIKPEDVLTRVPGIGPELARHLHEKLGTTTLEDLELAAHDGRLATVEGFGPRRVRAIQDALVGILSRSARRRTRGGEAAEVSEPPGPENKPDVQTLLEVDAEYRARAEAGELETIAPRRFNPEHKAWLPVLHTRHHNWSFTVLYSNTARAHELDATQDWVVIYYERGGRENQVTVVTGQKGILAGKRVVRGREAECRQYYEAHQEVPF